MFKILCEVSVNIKPDKLTIYLSAGINVSRSNCLRSIDKSFISPNYSFQHHNIKIKVLIFNGLDVMMMLML